MYRPIRDPPIGAAARCILSAVLFGAFAAVIDRLDKVRDELAHQRKASGERTQPPMAEFVADAVRKAATEEATRRASGPRLRSLMECV